MKNNQGPSPPGAKKKRGLLISSIILISILATLVVGTTSTVALDPHIVTGTVYEANGTTLSGANVTIINVATGESSNATSNATGVYSFNLLNLPSGWGIGHTIQVNTTNATDIGGLNSTQILIGRVSTTIDIWIGTTTGVTGINFYIIDESGFPVESALINIKDSSGDIQGTKMTDSDGKASTTLSNGLFIVTIAKSGYDDVVQSIRVHGTNTFTIRLGAEAEGIAITEYWLWFLIIFALVGIVALLFYLAKKL